MSEWEEENEFTAEQVRDLDLNDYNNLFNSGRFSNKDSKDDQILALFGVAQKLADDSKKLSEKSNRGPTKGNTSYIRDLPPWMM